MEVATQEIVGGDLSFAVSPQDPAVGGSSLIEVRDGPLVGSLELLVSAPDGGTEVLDGPGPWTVQWPVAGTWTLLLRSTHKDNTHETSTAVTVLAGGIAEMPAPEAVSADETPSPQAPVAPTLATRVEAEVEAVDMADADADAEVNPGGNLLNGAITVLLLAAGAFFVLLFLRWTRRQPSPAQSEIQSVQLQRGPTRIRSTGAGLRSLRVSLVVDRGATRVSVRTDTAQEAS